MDAENRLTSLESLAGAPSGSTKRMLFAYDWQSRRISKVVSNWTGSAWTNASDAKFAYDNWNLVSQLDSGNRLLQSYMWRCGHTGTDQNVGGIGDLLLITDSSGGVYFSAYDGNGNVCRLVDATSGTASANYEYAAFGDLIRMTGTSAQSNPFRFSTKFTDDEFDSLYYGYRYHFPNLGRWANRDPVEEQGGKNLYSFNLNQPLSTADFLGLKAVELEFNAFINANKGAPARRWYGPSVDRFLAEHGLTATSWIDEPGGTLWITSTSHRGPGGGSSKVKTIISTFDSTRIGELEKQSISESTTSDYSNRIRQNWLGFGSGYILQREKGLIRASSIKVKDLSSCESEITIKASGEYPFNVGGLWGALVPNIDYNVTYKLRKTESRFAVQAQGKHNWFPDYEGRISEHWIYHWPAPGAGPGLINLNASTSFFFALGLKH